MSEAIPKPHIKLDVSRSASEALARFQTDQEPDLREIAKVAEELPALGSSIVRAANASTHGLQHPITSPNHAMAMLGTLRIKELVDELIKQNKSLRKTTESMVPSPAQNDAK